MHTHANRHRDAIAELPKTSSLELEQHLQKLPQGLFIVGIMPELIRNSLNMLAALPV